MTEIIKFPGRGQEDNADDSEDLSRNIEIPSLDMLYEEDQILVTGKGSPIVASRIKEYMRSNERTKALKHFEASLANARGRYITENAPTDSFRKEALVGLAKHTYLIGRELEDEYLMDWALGELKRGLGTTRAMIVIENIQLKDNLK